MTTDFKNVVDSIVVRLKAKGIMVTLLRVRKMFNHSWLMLAGSHISKDDAM